MARRRRGRSWPWPPASSPGRSPRNSARSRRLDEAADAWKSATVALAARRSPAAVPQEQSALAALIQARQNLRKLLSNSQSAGQCRKFDRQQQQKLRKPPRRGRSKEAELARLEQDLRKLAEEQKFAEEIACEGLNPEIGGERTEPAGLEARATARPSARHAAAKEAERLQGWPARTRP